MKASPGRDRDDASIVDLIPALRAFARTFYRNPTDADDLVQDTLLKALKSFESFEPGTRLKSWMFTIMRNTFYTRARVYAREAPGAVDCVGARPAVEASQEWSLRSREVRSAIEHLPAHHREVLILIGVLGISYEETAEICGCAMGTVKSRLNRARQRILPRRGQPAGRGAGPRAAPSRQRRSGRTNGYDEGSLIEPRRGRAARAMRPASGDIGSGTMKRKSKTGRESKRAPQTSADLTQKVGQTRVGQIERVELDLPGNAISHRQDVPEAAGRRVTVFGRPGIALPKRREDEAIK